jgi:hypothetical protein
MSKTSTTLSGSNVKSASAIVCGAPLSKSSKSLAVNPPTGLPRSLTRTSTRTPSVPDRDRDRQQACE